MIQNNEGRYERSCRLFLSAKRRLIAATIQFFDLFSGIGGFREGLRRAGNFVCVGHCEVDTYADKNYRLLFDTEGEWYCNDARTIEPERMPDFDLLCAGFPCQAFSIAGKREGFADARGTLFFEIARILEAKRPSYFILENVPGLLSHDKGRTFCTILSTLSELGYHVEWKVLNSKDFGVPQARKRTSNKLSKTKQWGRLTGCIIYSPHWLRTLWFVGREGELYTHSRGAFSIARFDNLGNAKALTSGTSSRLAPRFLFFVYLRNIILTANQGVVGLFRQ